MVGAYVPIHFLKSLVELVADEEKLNAKYVLQGTGLNIDTLMTPGALATFSQSTAVYERVAELSTLPGIGFRSPSATSFADQGLLGAMLIMAPTVGVALEKLNEFIDVVGGTVEYQFRFEKGAFVVANKDKDSYSPRAHQLIAEENLAIWKFSSLPVPGLELHLREIRLDYPEPKHWRMYKNLFPNCNIRFNQPEIAAVLSKDVVDMPINTHNPDAFEKLERECVELIRRINPTMQARVAQFFNEQQPSEWTAAGIANGLHVSEKTLRRKLLSEGLRTKDLIATRKKNYALAAMEKGVADAAIADRLGFYDKTSFARSFKRWTGQTPAQYRKCNLR